MKRLLPAKNCNLKPLALPHKQRGYLMPLAIFILIAMGTMALTIARFSGQTANSSTQEGITVQTFYAAESGAQLAMNDLFYVASGGSPITQAQATINCGTIDASSYTFSGSGLNNCSAELDCEDTVASGITYYELVSVATCGAGELSSKRTVEVSSYLE